MVYVFNMSTTKPGNNIAIRNIMIMTVKSTRLSKFNNTIHWKQADISEHC